MQFGLDHQMQVVGHNLVWHSRRRPGSSRARTASPRSGDAARAHARPHPYRRWTIQGQIHGWDVVNEAIDEDGSLRKAPWHDGIGDDYVANAFEFAHEADPRRRALLQRLQPREAEPSGKARVALVRKLIAAGAPISGVGLQGHQKMDFPTAQQEADTIEAFAALGIKVHITELDVDVLPRTTRQNSADISATAAGSAASNPYTAGLPEEMQQALAKRYAELFDVFVKTPAGDRAGHLLGSHRREQLVEQFSDPRADELPAAVRSRGQAKAGIRRRRAAGSSWSTK